MWTVRQTLADPEGFDEWQWSFVFDLDAIVTHGELRAHQIGLTRG